MLVQKTIIILLLIILPIFSVTAKGKKKKSNEQKEYYANISTNYGLMSFALLNETPKHRDNFIKLARNGYYTNIDFHRVVSDFLIQAGDPATKKAYSHKKIGDGGADYNIDAEIINNIHHFKGTLGMAREDDSENPKKESSGSHFYIVQGRDEVTDEYLDKIDAKREIKMSQSVREKYKKKGGSPHLDGSYTIFGYITSGMNVLDSIAKTAVNEKHVPFESVKIKNIVILKKSVRKNKKVISYETYY